MALQIVKKPSLLPNLEDTYGHYAAVEVIRRSGLAKLFAPRAGFVSVSPACDPACPVIQATPPAWRGGERDEWETLQQCYTSVLELAEKHHCDAITLPLLTAEDPKFPAYIDFKIALDTIRAFLEKCAMDVFLLVTRPALQMPELRSDVERFLNRNFFENLPNWGYSSFSEGDARFATITPTVPGFAMAGWECGGEPNLQADCYISSEESRRFDTGSLPSRSELEAKLRATDAGFSETLLKLIDKTGKKDSEIYNKANVSRQHFSKIRNNPDYRPTKSTAIAFAIALGLDMSQTRDLIGRAGYTLTNSSKFDVIIMYFIEARNYNMFDINETLYEFDQNLLGA